MKLLARMDEVSVVLFDETEGGLDEGSKAVMDSIEQELIESNGKYIVIRISHEMKEDMARYNKIINMS